MADGTKIEWTDATWNPITGCSVVSPGCTNCYAMRLAGTRLRNHPSRTGLTRDTKAGPVWNGQVRLNRQELHKPTQWKRPRNIFVVAHGDLFAQEVPDDWILDVLTVIASNPQHQFQVLTKRAARLREVMSRPDLLDDIYANWSGFSGAAREVWSWPLHNLWLGVSAEDQPRAEERIPELLETPAAIRWISAEPLLGIINPRRLRYGAGHIDAREGYVHNIGRDRTAERTRINWVVAGGESGRGARAMHPAAPRLLRDQCAETGTPYFFKQWGSWLDADQLLDRIQAGPALILRDGQPWTPSRPLNFHDAAFLANLVGHPFEHRSDGGTNFRLDKTRAGRLLDGIEHNGYPEVRHVG